METLTKCILIILTSLLQQYEVKEEPVKVEQKVSIKEEVEICNTQTSFVSFMDYRMITDTSSEQWKLQQRAYTDIRGNRVISDYRLVAMSERYGPVGTKYTVTLESGYTVKVMVADVKANRVCTHDDTSMIEAIVDTNYISQDTWDYGSIPDMRERVIKIEKDE